MDIPVNMKFCFEGMEESGSEGLDDLLFARKDTEFMQNVDYVCISDNYWLGKNKPCITYGLRGICYFFIEIECCSKDLHSGVFGGSVPEGMADLIYMMNTLIDKDGKILIDGLMDEVAPVTDGKISTVWKFQDFLSFRFYVKSTLRNLEMLKLPFLPILVFWILLIWYISVLWRAKIQKSQISEPLNVLKWQILHF